jgi:hypothetical protein
MNDLGLLGFTSCIGSLRISEILCPHIMVYLLFYVDLPLNQYFLLLFLNLKLFLSKLPENFSE